MDPREELDALRRLAELEGRAQQSAGEQATADTPAWKVPFVAGGRTLDRLAAGLRQAVPEPIRGAVDKAGAAMGMAPGPDITPEGQGQNSAYFAPLEKRYPLSTFGGEMVANLPAATPMGMALVGGLEYGTPGERAARAGMGYAGGKAGQALGAGVARMLGPRSADTAPKLADEFFAGGNNKFGIPLSVGQQTQSKPAQIIESVLANLPGSSGVIAKARDRTYGAFNEAVAKTFGEDASKLTPEVMGEARKRAGSAIGEIAERNTMQFDEPLFNEMLRISERAKNDLTPDQGKVVVNWINNVVRDVRPDSTVAGSVYKAYDSRLGSLSKEYGGTLGNVLGDLRQSLRTAMDRSISPEDAAKWATARKQYMNLMTVADAAKNTGDGSLSPARLLQAVNAAQKNAKFGSGNDLAELAQWAKTTLPDKIPNSGTAQRLFWQKAISNPLTTVGAIGGLGYGADQLGAGPEGAAAGIPLAYLLSRGMAGKPVSAATEELLKRLGGGLLGAGALTAYR